MSARQMRLQRFILNKKKGICEVKLRKEIGRAHLNNFIIADKYQTGAKGKTRTIQDTIIAGCNVKFRKG